MNKLLRGLHNTAYKQDSKSAFTYIFTMSGDITHLPPPSSPHFPCRQRAHWCSLFQQNFKGQTGHPFFSCCSITLTFSTKFCCWEFTLKDPCISDNVAGWRLQKENGVSLAAEKAIYLLHPTCESKESFCFQRILGLPLDSLLFHTEVTFSHSHLPWPLRFSGTTECTIIT